MLVGGALCTTNDGKQMETPRLQEPLVGGDEAQRQSTLVTDSVTGLLLGLSFVKMMDRQDSLVFVIVELSVRLSGEAYENLDLVVVV